MEPAPTFDRRQFLEASVAGATLLLAGSRARAAAASPEGATHGPLAELPPGAVEPQGWLRTYMQKQAAELALHLPEISYPFSEPYWAGYEVAPSWWPWEQRAYWIDGATRLGILLRDPQLLARTLVPIRYTLAHPGADGYLGPTLFENPVGDEHRWPQTVFFRSLMACADAQPAPDGLPGPESIAAAMQRHYRNDPADYALPQRNITNVEPMLWCYGRTGDAQLLARAEDAWQRYLAKAAVDPESGDLGEARVYANTPIHAHGVTYAETAKLPAILFLHTGRPEYLRFALAAQQRILDHHMLVDGIPSTSEWFRTRTSLDSHETCDIVDHTWGWGYLLQATGDGAWGDRIERAVFNAGPGAIRSDWKALQYFSCPNQPLATEKSDHNVMAHGGYMMSYQPNPGRNTACCGGNVHRLYPNHVSRMWMRTRGGPDEDGGLAATLYGPSTVRTTAGRERTPVVIEQATSYPFRDTIQLTFAGEQAAEFPLSLRIPAWCSRPALRVNGLAVALAVHNGFATIRRRFAPGDTLTLTLPMAVARTRWPYGGVALERGPLVYALPVDEAATPYTEPKYSTAAFPGYNAMPTSPWNYALALKPGPLDGQVDIQEAAAGAEPAHDPWTAPPTTLTVPARVVENYRLQGITTEEDQFFTPPLPDLAFTQVSPRTESITLVPYGCTRLRITIFPDAGTAAEG